MVCLRTGGVPSEGTRTAHVDSCKVSHRQGEGRGKRGEGDEDVDTHRRFANDTAMARNGKKCHARAEDFCGDGG
jgi:hypothetical protein